MVGPESRRPVDGEPPVESSLRVSHPEIPRSLLQHPRHDSPAFSSHELLKLPTAWSYTRRAATSIRIRKHGASKFVGRFLKPERSAGGSKCCCVSCNASPRFDRINRSEDIFESRIREFIAPTERGKRLAVHVGDNIYPIRKKTRRNGRFIGYVRIPRAEVEGLQRDGHLADGWLKLRIDTPYGDDRGFVGRARLIEAQGISIISDIDDTIKETDVHSRRAFIREYVSARVSCD